jgi:hypothetical protein
MIKPLNKICTFKLLKVCRRVSGNFGLTKKLLKYSFNTTKHDHTQVLKHRKLSQNSDGLFFPTHHTAKILLPLNFISLEPTKMPSVRKGLGMMTRLLDY